MRERRERRSRRARERKGELMMCSKLRHQPLWTAVILISSEIHLLLQNYAYISLKTKHGRIYLKSVESIESAIRSSRRTILINKIIFNTYCALDAVTTII